MFCVFLCALCVQGKATSHTSILPHNSLVSNATPAHIFATTTLARQSTIATQDSQDLNTLKNLQDSQDLHSSPQSLSLESCITKARAVYPLQKISVCLMRA